MRLYLIIQTSDWAKAMIALYSVLQKHFCIQDTCFASSEDGTFCSQPGQSLQQTATKYKIKTLSINKISWLSPLVTFKKEAFSSRLWLKFSVMATIILMPVLNIVFSQWNLRFYRKKSTRRIFDRVVWFITFFACSAWVHVQLLILHFAVFSNK